MRWLLLKDLQILKRSPLLTALLVIYPIVLAVLIGFAVSRGPEKPEVAFFNEIESTEGLELGEGGFSQQNAFAELCDRIDCVTVESRDEAVQKVREGDVLAALVIPEDFVDDLQSQLAGTGLDPASVEVYVNEDDPVKARLVDDRISGLITEANLRLSDEISQQLLGYLDILVEGGEFEVPFLGQTLDVLGLKRTEQILKAVRSELEGPQRQVVDQVIQFAQLARENLGFADELLGSVAEPISVEKEVVEGDVPTARHLRDLGRDRDHPDVRHGPARRRIARARARGEHLRPAHPRPRRPLSSDRGEDRPRNDLLDRGRDRPPRRARAVREHPVGAVPPDPGRDSPHRRRDGGDRAPRSE